MDNYSSSSCTLCKVPVVTTAPALISRLASKEVLVNCNRVSHSQKRQQQWEEDSERVTERRKETAPSAFSLSSDSNPDKCRAVKEEYYSYVNRNHHLITKRINPDSSHACTPASDPVDGQVMNRIEIPEDSAIVMLTCRTTPAFGNERRRCDKSQPHRVTEDVVAGFVMEAFNKLLPFASGEQRVEKNKAVEIARLITDAMKGPHRFFHSSGHAVKLASFNKGKFDNPAVTLAALFHDVVYIQVDDEINPPCSQYIPEGVVKTWKDSKTGCWNGHILVDLEELRSSTDYVSKALLATCIIFGVSTNSELSHRKGLNEFLSALTAIYALSPILKSLDVLVEIALIIEATIPFRSRDSETGLTVGETLRERLNKICNLFAELSHWNEMRREDAIERAIFLGDKDVGSFIQEVDEFLSDTFELLPETNWALWDRDSLTCHQYRTAIDGMYRFFSFLEYATIFQRYASFPSEEEFQEIVKKSRKNVRIGKAYMSLKLISTGLLGALSDLHLFEDSSSLQEQQNQKARRERKGGDDKSQSIPFAVLLGDIDKQNKSDTDLSHYNSEVFADNQNASGAFSHHDSTSNSDDNDINNNNSIFHNDILADLEQLLVKGLVWGVDFDLKKPRLELEIFHRIPASELETLLSNLESLWQSEEASPHEILQQFPKRLVRQVIEAQIRLQRNTLSSPDEKFGEDRTKLVASLNKYLETA